MTHQFFTLLHLTQSNTSLILPGLIALLRLISHCLARLHHTGLHRSPRPPAPPGDLAAAHPSSPAPTPFHGTSLGRVNSATSSEAMHDILRSRRSMEISGISKHLYDHGAAKGIKSYGATDIQKVTRSSSIQVCRSAGCTGHEVPRSSLDMLNPVEQLISVRLTVNEFQYSSGFHYCYVIPCFLSFVLQVEVQGLMLSVKVHGLVQEARTIYIYSNTTTSLQLMKIQVQDPTSSCLTDMILKWLNCYVALMIHLCKIMILVTILIPEL